MASSTAAATSPFLGTRLPEHSVPKAVGRFQARFGFGSKKSRPKKAKAPPTSDRPLWFPGAKAPEWLDGSLVGDYGFDPFRLGKPVEYLQFDFDSLDQNLAKNPSGDVIGTRTESADVKSTPFQSYPEVFGLQRFRECELIHGRRRDQTTTPSRQSLPSRCPLREDRPDQTVRIGSELPKRERRELVDPLLENADVFIWSPAAMPAVDPEVAQHHLSISPEVRPVKQRPRQFVSE